MSFHVLYIRFGMVPVIAQHDLHFFQPAGAQRTTDGVEQKKKKKKKKRKKRK